MERLTNIELVVELAEKPYETLFNIISFKFQIHPQDKECYTTPPLLGIYIPQRLTQGTFLEELKEFIKNLIDYSLENKEMPAIKAIMCLNKEIKEIHKKHIIPYATEEEFWASPNIMAEESGMKELHENFRESLAEFFAEYKFKKKEHIKILEAMCGTATLTPYEVFDKVNISYAVEGCDIAMQNLEQYKTNASTVWQKNVGIFQVDVNATEFKSFNPKDKYDAIIIAQGIRYIKDLGNFFKAISNSLNKNGVFILLEGHMRTSEVYMKYEGDLYEVGNFLTDKTLELYKSFTEVCLMQKRIPGFGFVFEPEQYMFQVYRKQ